MKYDIDSNLPRLHPRHEHMENARRELAEFLRKLREKYTITPSERFALLGEAICDEATWCIRSERAR